VRRSPAELSDVPACLFAKPPRAGEVKTRLEVELGAEGAALLAGALARDSWEALAGLGWATPVLATTEPDAAEWRAEGWEPRWSQGEGDLGARLERILRRALETSPAALAIGSDSPGLPHDRFAAAREALARHDAVLGPSADGGFYLIGLRRCPEGLLADLPWSVAETAERTLARLRAFGLSVATLAPWFDVDQPEDLERLRDLLVDEPGSAPATLRALAELDRARRRLSVIVPVLDEEKRIERQLNSLAATPGVDESIVVDGGSRDRTLERARGVAGARVIEAPRGRARQMNAGARSARGGILLFLHADVGLPADARRWIDSALGEERVVAGAFRTRTTDDEPGRRSWAAPLLRIADGRSFYSGLPYGDQALFLRAATFRRLGGFTELALFEDLDLSRRLRRLGAIRTVPTRVRVSGRRFLARPLRACLLVNTLPLLYRLGVPPARLARLYALGEAR
jgi:rSAM/selenodomain-associated transferase 2/rSAM/selenodomain-associated transferase 1